MNDQQFIVAEVSKNWNKDSPASDLVCQRFEHVINHNLQRGYRLHSFTLHRLMTEPDCLNETIIAVFERTVDGERPRPTLLPAPP